MDGDLLPMVGCRKGRNAGRKEGEQELAMAL